MSMPTRVTVDAALAGLRLDTFLARSGMAKGTADARRSIAADLVRVDGRRAKKGQALSIGQTVELEGLALSAGPGPVADAEAALSVLYEDADFVAIDKPAGMPSHPLRPGETGTLANMIVARFPECASAAPDPREGGLGHRLDLGTSGVLLVARNRAAWLGLRHAMGEGGASKTYLAEVVGTPGVSVVDADIGRVGRHGAKVRIGAGRVPMPATTHLRVVQPRGATCLVEAKLERGRPHQVRVHLAHIGCPILGDRAYGDASSIAIADERQVALPHLHAAAVRLRHPLTGDTLVVQAPPPLWARDF